MIREIITAILDLIGLASSFNKKRERNSRLSEDKALADAIKSGDEDTVGKIRERRKKYPNAILVLITVTTFLSFSSGCSTFKKPYKQVVLTEGAKPYQLPPGDYQDAKGVVHREEIPRWSLSEADLFRDTQELDTKKNSWVKENATILFAIVAFFILMMLQSLFYRRTVNDLYKRSRNEPGKS